MPVFSLSYDGLEVGEKQEWVDWSEVACDERVRYVYLQATTGGLDRNPYYEYNLQGARRYGILTGSIHVFTDRETPKKQVENFVGAARPGMQDIVPMVELLPPYTEWKDSVLCDSLKRFLWLCARQFGRAPIVRLTPEYYALFSERLKPYHLSLTEQMPDTLSCTLRRLTEDGQLKGVPQPLPLCVVDSTCPLHDLLLLYPKDRYVTDTATVFTGIDVSKHQGKIDWQQLTANHTVRFAFIKATEGSDWEDPQFKRNIREAKKAGLLVGAYHFFSVHSPARTQFEWFRKHVGKEDIDFRPMLDVERRADWSKQAIQDSVEVFMRMCEAHYGVRPILYSYQRFFNAWLAPEFNDEILWIANYNDHVPYVYPKGGVNGSAMWQYTDSGRLTGISNRVDMNVVRQSFSLERLLLPKPSSSE